MSESLGSAGARSRIVVLTVPVLWALFLASPATAWTSDEASWGYHALAGGAMTLGADLVLDHPLHSTLISIAFTVGHEVGQFRDRGHWSTDSTLDVVSGTLGAVFVGWLRARRREAPDGSLKPGDRDDAEPVQALGLPSEPFTREGSSRSRMDRALAPDTGRFRAILPVPVTANTLVPSLKAAPCFDGTAGRPAPTLYGGQREWLECAGLNVELELMST